jgi:hypothetical protein
MLDRKCPNKKCKSKRRTTQRNDRDDLRIFTHKCKDCGKTWETSMKL